MGKMTNKIILLLLIASLMVNITQYRNNNQQHPEITRMEDSIKMPPEIMMIDISGLNDEVILKDNWYTVPDNGKIKIRVDIKGDCSEIDFYLVPTGTEMVMEQRIVGVAPVAPGEKSIEHILEVQKGTMGHLFVEVRNFSVSRRSKLHNIYCE